MPAPFKRPNSGYFWFRKRVPDELRRELRAKEITRSLKTKDLKLAKALNDRMHAEYDARWADLRGQKLRLDPRGADALAGEFYRFLLAKDQRNPGHPRRWETKQLGLSLGIHYLPKKVGDPFVASSQWWLRREMDVFLIDRGLRLDEESAHLFLHEAARAVMLSCSRLGGFARKQYGPDPNEHAFAPSEDPRKASVTWEKLFDEYAKDRRLAERTRRSWRSVLLKLMVFVNATHPAELTFAHLESFRELLSNRGLDAGQTIRRGYFGAIKAFLTWCAGRGHIPTNPASSMIVLPDPKDVEREPGYRDVEAVRILAATLRPQGRRISPRTADTRRWVPWLCAYTGARVEEIVQLRHEDIKRTDWHMRYPDPVWYIDLTPAAGHIKAGVFRHVPIHPDLVELGFLEFLRTRKGLPLFLEPGAQRSRTDLRGLASSGANRLGRWIRTIVSDARIAPNHAWRHRFISEAGEAMVPEEIRDAITGHAPESEGGKYGYKRPQLLLRWTLTMTSHLDLLRYHEPDLVKAAVAAIGGPAEAMPPPETSLRTPRLPAPVPRWRTPSIMQIESVRGSET